MEHLPEALEALLPIGLFLVSCAVVLIVLVWLLRDKNN